MAAHIRELENASPDELEELLDEYYVPRVEGATPIESILQWLSSDHPMTVAWGYDPTEILNGYMLASDPKRYFQEITGVPSEKFMNETERIFYLTRGYGRPNKYISPADLSLRRFYMGASPTALIALSDVLGICPTQQDPRVVLEALGEVDLRTIDRFHQRTVQKITRCLGDSKLCHGDELAMTTPLTCTKCVTRSVGLKDCNPDALSCFQQFLESIGALTTVRYDPRTNSFISGISQLELYQDVIPGKKWSYSEVKEMPNIYIKSILRRLPDIELVRISTPYGEQNIKPGNSLILRGDLLESSYRFLTDKRYFSLPNGKIGFGRAVDSKLQEMTLEELKQSLLQKGVLIDPYENPVPPEFAQMKFDDPEIQRIISRTRALELDNKEYLTELTQEQKDRFREELISGIDPDSSDTEFRRLILWSEQNGKWVPLGMDFEEYIKNWKPLFSEIIKQTVKYYIQTL